MADKEHLAMLDQGVDAWNEWRKKDPVIRPNLSWTNLRGANLREVDLRDANLSGANIHEANLRGADLSGTDLSWTNLRGANLRDAKLFETVLGNVNLTEVKGLDSCKHYGPSSVDYRTLQKSRNLPPNFLRGCGLPDTLINYLPAIFNEAIQFYSCFISYSSKDDDFAKRLHADLQDNGVRCWFAPEDLKTGDRIRIKIDESIRVHDKLLLILSKDSIKSDWVEQEVETALAKEREENRTVLFPIRLDNAVMEVNKGWPSLIHNTRHIANFSKWKNHDAFEKEFEKLLRDLKAEEQTP